jgi:hypothetical protein
MKKSTNSTLISLIQLAQRAFAVEDEPSFGFLTVNETNFLAPYRQALLWSSSQNGGQIVALSSIASPDKRAPYIEHMTQMLKQWDSEGSNKELQVITPDMKSSLNGTSWEKWLPENGLWLPLVCSGNQHMGGLLLVREQEWTKQEKKLLTELAAFYANAWEALHKRSNKRRWLSVARITPKGWGKSIMLLLAIAAMFTPVQLSVLAPATVVAKNPAIITIPITGTIDQLNVKPNQEIHRGERLFTLESSEVNSKLIIAKKALAVMRAQYRLALQQNLLNQSRKAQKNLFEKRMAQQSAEINAVQNILDRHQRFAPTMGWYYLIMLMN